MKKKRYPTPTAATITIGPRAVMADDLVIAVSGTTIPEDSDGKDLDFEGFEDDMEDDEFYFQLPPLRFSRRLWDDDWKNNVVRLQ